MNDFILSCCSTADVTEEKLRAMDVHYICNPYTMNGVAYKDDLGKTWRGPKVIELHDIPLDRLPYYKKIG